MAQLSESELFCVVMFIVCFLCVHVSWVAKLRLLLLLLYWRVLGGLSWLYLFLLCGAIFGVSFGVVMCFSFSCLMGFCFVMPCLFRGCSCVCYAGVSLTAVLKLFYVVWCVCFGVFFAGGSVFVLLLFWHIYTRFVVIFCCLVYSLGVFIGVVISSVSSCLTGFVVGAKPHIGVD